MAPLISRCVLGLLEWSLAGVCTVQSLLHATALCDTCAVFEKSCLRRQWAYGRAAALLFTFSIQNAEPCGKCVSKFRQGHLKEVVIFSKQDLQGPEGSVDSGG